jgi:hypothetical protein
LKLEHLIVLQALEDANRSHERAVGVSEIAAEISERDRKRLERTYTNSLPTIIGKTLELLRARGLVFSPGAFNRRRFYGSVHVLDAGSTNLPEIVWNSTVPRIRSNLPLWQHWLESFTPGLAAHNRGSDFPLTSGGWHHFLRAHHCKESQLGRE